MKPFIPPDLVSAFPEIFLTIMTLILLMLGSFQKKENYTVIANFALFSLIAVAAVVLKFFHEPLSTFGDRYVVDTFTSYMKILIIVGSSLSILMASGYVERQKINRFEYPILIMFSTIGMMLMVSANGLMSLYVALELQSLPLYILAAFQRDSTRSTEAGLKYFILGALSSGMLLYGASLIYGYTGSTNFNDIAAAISTQISTESLGLITGMVLLLSGLAFKIGAVPFHMWTPDVYEGSPTSVTAFFAIAPKIAAIALLCRVLNVPFKHLVIEWSQIIYILSVGSMILGAVAAIGQENIKRMLAYSSIGHMGYALIGLLSANTMGIKAVVIYVTLYMVATAGTFAIVLLMKQKERSLEHISDLSGLSKQQPLLAFAMAIMMFSMAGIPPLAGFFGKLFIFQAAVDSGFYVLAVIGVLTSVVAAYYYLRVIKVMYFDIPRDEGIDKADDPHLTFVLSLSSAIVLLFIIIPSPFLSSAEAAASALLK